MDARDLGVENVESHADRKKFQHNETLEKRERELDDERLPESTTADLSKEHDSHGAGDYPTDAKPRYK
eukprot:ANDGO_08540.mRNA.1 hypothetical protein